MQVDAAKLGVKAESPLPDFDGCVQWGGFEEAQIEYLTLHNRFGQKRWLPGLSDDAVEGKHSAILAAGRTELPPILSTTGIPSRLACYFKADRPTEVSVDIGGKRQTFKIGTKWKRVQMDFTPPEALMGVFHAGITTPAGRRVLVDAISFHPVVAGKR